MLRRLLFTEHGFNTAMIGKDAAIIARQAGFSAPDARILVTPVDLVQPEEKLVREKLCPVLGFARVGNIDQAISSARSMMRVSGGGHSAAIHSRTEANILAFAAALPALRVAVNAGCSLGAAGFETNLGPSMTIGTGTSGGSSLSDNLTPHHLVQYARIAYNKAVERGVRQFRRPRSPRPAANLATECRPGGQQFRHRRAAARAAQDHPGRAGRGPGGVRWQPFAPSSFSTSCSRRPCAVWAAGSGARCRAATWPRRSSRWRPASTSRR